MLYKVDIDRDCFEKKLCKSVFVKATNRKHVYCKKHGAMLAVAAFNCKDTGVKKRIYRCPSCNIGIIADLNRETDQKEFCE